MSWDEDILKRDSGADCCSRNVEKEKLSQWSEKNRKRIKNFSPDLNPTDM